MSLADLSDAPPLEIAPRLGRLRAELGPASIDALLVTKHENVRYLTGFSGSAGMLLVTANGAVLTTDGRYGQQSAMQLEAAAVEAEIVIGKMDTQFDALARVAVGSPRVGLEGASLTWALQLRLAELFEAELVSTSGLVERLRAVKDAGELARIEAACDVADVALAQMKERLRDRPSELEFAAELDFEMRRRGAQGSAFETIVAAGPNSAMPHHRPSERPIEAGELIVIDFGATVDGYRSDMTRTFVVGEPRPEQLTLLDAVLASQRAGVRQVQPGVSAGSVDDAARESLADAGYADAFVHSTGHGVGLEIHEAPAVAQGVTDILAPGSVVTVEPGVYLANHGGVRIEDTLVVTDNGCRALTKSTKDYLL